MSTETRATHNVIRIDLNIVYGLLLYKKWAGKRSFVYIKFDNYKNSFMQSIISDIENLYM